MALVNDLEAFGYFTGGEMHVLRYDQVYIYFWHLMQLTFYKNSLNTIKCKGEVVNLITLRRHSCR
jgi:hypothetical protein